MSEHPHLTPEGHEFHDLVRCILTAPMPSTPHAVGERYIQLIFIALASYADADLEAFPAATTLAKDITKGNPRTVTTALRYLEAAGYIVDTGRRRSRCKVWRLFPDLRDSITPSAAHPPLDEAKHLHGPTSTVPPRADSPGDFLGDSPGDSPGDFRGYPVTKGQEEKGPTTCELNQLTAVWTKENPQIPVDEAIAHAANDPSTRTPIHRLNKNPVYRQAISRELNAKRKAAWVAQRAAAPRCTECNRTLEECTAINTNLDSELACQGYLDSLRDGSRPAPSPRF